MELEHDLLSDNELVERARNNDTAALEQLFLRYREDLLSLYSHKTGSEADAMDMLQETFIKVYVNLHRFNPEYTFSQWIHTIARNTFIDHTRRRKEAVLSMDKVENGQLVTNPPSQTPTPEQEMIISQSNSVFNAMLESLPEKYRTMIILRFFKEYSYEEIAEKLSMPIGTVKTQIHRAREKLYELICRNDI